MKEMKDKQSLSSVEIVPGIGYSSDTQSNALSICFAPSKVEKSAQASQVKSDSAVDISSLEKEFNASASIHVGGGLFSGDATAQYFASLEENNY